jgi:hypothetical protein
MQAPLCSLSHNRYPTDPMAALETGTVILVARYGPGVEQFFLRGGRQGRDHGSLGPPDSTVCLLAQEHPGRVADSLLLRDAIGLLVARTQKDAGGEMASDLSSRTPRHGRAARHRVVTQCAEPDDATRVWLRSPPRPVRRHHRRFRPPPRPGATRMGGRRPLQRAPTTLGP